MKKNLFKNGFGLGISVLLLTSILSSCQKNANDVLNDKSNDVNSAAQARRNVVSTMPLKVTVNYTSGNKITSDGQGDYTNGQQNVSAYFDQYGNFQFDTNPVIRNKRYNALRSLNFTFDSPVSGYSTANPANITTNAKGNYRMVSQNDGQPAAQSMINGTSQTIRLGGGFADGTSTDWNFSLQYNNVANTSYATITRTALNTWTITGATNPPIARLIENGTVIGFYNLPFSITLTKL